MDDNSFWVLVVCMACLVVIGIAAVVVFVLQDYY